MPYRIILALAYLVTCGCATQPNTDRKDDEDNDNLLLNILVDSAFKARDGFQRVPFPTIRDRL